MLVAVGLGLGLAPAEATPSVSVDPLVRRLPVSLRSSWTALFESDSLQSASVTRPRIVLFDSTTSVAFSGQDEELERWSFDLGTDRFTFSSERPRGAGRAAAGAKACAACHGADPRPIWHEYPTWRGAFGSANDRLRGTEATQFAQFMRVRSRLSSYRWLRPGAAAGATSPYTSAKDPASERSFARRPNTRFGFIAARLNARRVARLLRESPHYKTYRELLLFTYNDCDWAPSEERTRAAVVKALRRSLRKANVAVGDMSPRGRKVPFAALSALFGVHMQDLDLRYTYDDPRSRALVFEMPKRDGKLVPGPNNLYSDGWAIYGITEYVSHRLYVDLVARDATLDGSFRAAAMKDFYTPSSATMGERNRADAALIAELESLAMRLVRGQNDRGCRILADRMKSRF